MFRSNFKQILMCILLWQGQPAQSNSFQSNCAFDVVRLDDAILLTEDSSALRNRLRSHNVHPRMDIANEDLRQIRQMMTTTSTGVKSYLPKTSRSILFTCPDALAISPCTCSISEEITLDCSEATSFEEIKTILNTATIPYTDFEKFIYAPIAVDDTGDIPSQLFGPLTFSSVYIYSTTATSMADDAFAGSEATLVKVILDSNGQLSDMSFSWVSDFVNLSHLGVGGSVLGTISVFGSAPNLTYVGISNCQVTTIEENAFKALSGLLVLDLSGNHLTDIGSEMLMISSIFLGVYMDFNKLQNVAPFPGAQPVLLELENNQLTTFDEAVFEPILESIQDCPFTSYVSVTDNPIDCQEMTWVYVNDLYSLHVLSNCPKE